MKEIRQEVVTRIPEICDQVYYNGRKYTIKSIETKLDLEAYSSFNEDDSVTVRPERIIYNNHLRAFEIL